MVHACAYSYIHKHIYAGTYACTHAAHMHAHMQHIYMHACIVHAYVPIRTYLHARIISSSGYAYTIYIHCINTWVCIRNTYTYTQMHTATQEYMNVCIIHAYAYSYIRKYLHTFSGRDILSTLALATHTYIHTYTHTCIRIYMHIYIQ